MEIRPIVLREELMASYREVSNQITVIKENAEKVGIDPMRMQDTSGAWVLVPLFVARAQILHALTLLNQKK